MSAKQPALDQDLELIDLHELDEEDAESWLLSPQTRCSLQSLQSAQLSPCSYAGSAGPELFALAEPACVGSSPSAGSTPPRGQPHPGTAHASPASPARSITAGSAPRALQLPMLPVTSVSRIPRFSGGGAPGPATAPAYPREAAPSLTRPITGTARPGLGAHSLAPVSYSRAHSTATRSAGGMGPSALPRAMSTHTRQHAAHSLQRTAALNGSSAQPRVGTLSSMHSTDAQHLLLARQWQTVGGALPSAAGSGVGPGPGTATATRTMRATAPEGPLLPANLGRAAVFQASSQPHAAGVMAASIMAASAAAGTGTASMPSTATGPGGAGVLPRAGHSILALASPTHDVTSPARNVAGAGASQLRYEEGWLVPGAPQGHAEAHAAAPLPAQAPAPPAASSSAAAPADTCSVGQLTTAPAASALPPRLSGSLIPAAGPTAAQMPPPPSSASSATHIAPPPATHIPPPSSSSSSGSLLTAVGPNTPAAGQPPASYQQPAARLNAHRPAAKQPPASHQQPAARSDVRWDAHDDMACHAAGGTHTHTGGTPSSGFGPASHGSGSLPKALATTSYGSGPSSGALSSGSGGFRNGSFGAMPTAIPQPPARMNSNGTAAAGAVAGVGSARPAGPPSGGSHSGRNGSGIPRAPPSAQPPAAAGAAAAAASEASAAATSASVAARLGHDEQLSRKVNAVVISHALLMECVEEAVRRVEAARREAAAQQDATARGAAGAPHRAPGGQAAKPQAPGCGCSIM